MTPAPNDAERLESRFRRLILSIFALVLVILAGLIWREYQLQIARELDLRRTGLQERIVAVEALVTAADVHVSSLRSAMEKELSLPVPVPMPRPILQHYAPNTAIPLSFFDKPDEGMAHRIGTLFGIPTRLELRPAGLQEARIILDLFPMMAAAHQAQPFFRWSYFFSAGHDLMGIYPWGELASFIGSEDPVAAMEGFYGYDVYKLTTMPSNAGRNATWTPVYIDAGGAGLMVSHNAPVDVYGRQRGMVGADLLLGVLSDRLGSGAIGGGITAIVDQAGNLVADSRHLAANSKDVTAATALIDLPLDQVQGPFAAVSGHYAMRQPIAGTPWLLYDLVPREVVDMAAAQKVMPYLAFMGLLALTMAGGYALISTGYLRPAFQLVGTLERRATGEIVDGRKIAPQWRPWFDRVSEIFASRDETLEKLVQAQEKSAAIISVALDAVVTTDNRGHVVDFNPAAEKLFGRTAAESVGKSIGDLIVPPHLRDAHQAGMERHMRTGTTHVLGQRLELDALHDSGRVFPVEIQIHQLKDLADVRYAAYIRDLTEQKASAVALRDQQEKLYQAEKLTAMGSLLAGLAHELNNPLAVVIAQTSLLEEVAADGPTRSRATKIRVAAERCGRIVRTFLTMARKQTPQRSSVDLRQLVQQSLDVLAYGLKSSGVEVIQKHSPDLPAIEADPDQLNQVIINLLVNAQQAFGDRPGERMITVSSRPLDSGQVELVLADNGPGIPPEVINRIFEAFFTTKPVGVGTGIGLSVCRSIIEAHGGRITAENGPEGGARFTITLPSQLGLAVPSPAAAASPTHVGPVHRLLLVDDEPEVAEALGDYLEIDGHSIRKVHSIPDALAIMATEKFDAVFCDLRMPGGGGAALWNEVALRDPALADRFVFVTGDMVAGPETLRIASAGRPLRILEKPFGREDIRKAVQLVFNDTAS